MSRTNNTRPGWLVDFVDGTIRHDHRAGLCIPEAFDDAHRSVANRTRIHSRQACPRWASVEKPCPGHEHCPAARKSLDWAIRDARTYGDQTTLQRLLARDARRPYTCGEVHTEWWSTGQTCNRCDLIDQRYAITCTRSVSDSYFRTLTTYGVSKSAKNARRRVEHAARARTRRALADAAADWNTYGWTDLQPEPTRHRHSCAWDRF